MARESSNERVRCTGSLNQKLLINKMCRPRLNWPCSSALVKKKNATYSLENMVYVENVFIHYSTVPECRNLQNITESEVGVIQRYKVTR